MSRSIAKVSVRFPARPTERQLGEIMAPVVQDGRIFISQPPSTMVNGIVVVDQDDLVVTAHIYAVSTFVMLGITVKSNGAWHPAIWADLDDKDRYVVLGALRRHQVGEHGLEYKDQDSPYRVLDILEEQ